MRALAAISSDDRHGDCDVVRHVIVYKRTGKIGRAHV